MILEGKEDDPDAGRLAEEVVSAAGQLVKESPDIGAVVLGCTDMSPFAYLIQSRVGITIFDLITLISMVYNDVVVEGYHRIMPVERWIHAE